MEIQTQTSNQNKENIQKITKTRLHGYLQHKVAKTLKGRHPYKPVVFKDLRHPNWVTTPVSENIIPKMKGNYKIQESLYKIKFPKYFTLCFRLIKCFNI